MSPTDPSRRQSAGQSEERAREGADPRLSPEGANREGTDASRSSAAARGVDAGAQAAPDPRAADSAPRAMPSAAKSPDSGPDMQRRLREADGPAARRAAAARDDDRPQARPSGGEDAND